MGLLILHLTSYYVTLRVPLAELCLTAMIASSLDGGHGCHNIQVSGADARAKQCRMPLRNPVSKGRFGFCS